MSKVVTPDECTDFQAHQWKKDMCVNCSRSRAQHTKTVNPAARKPKPRPTATAPTTSPPKIDTSKPVSKLGNAHDMKLKFLADKSPPNKSNKSPPKNKTETSKVDNRTNTRQPVPRTTTGQTPTYANAQVVKQTSNGETKKAKIETTLTKSPAIHNTGRSVSIDSSSTGTKQVKTDLSRSQSAKEDVTIRDSTKRNRKHRMSRPAGPPPQAPKSPDPANSKTASTDSIHLDQIPSELLEDIQKQLAEGDEGAHYYHKYDITASMRRKAKGSQQSAMVDIETRLATASPLERAALIAKIKSTLGEAACQDVLPNDVTPDQIAMPYNIVDVSAMLPKDDRPPRLPSSPAPSKEDSLNRASLQRKANKTTAKVLWERMECILLIAVV